MTIASYDEIVSNRVDGKDDDRYWFKSTSITPGAAGQWYSLFTSAGNPAAMTISTNKNGALMDATNSGAIPIKASTSEDAYLLSAGINVASAGGFSAVMYVDVVWASNVDTSAAYGAISFPALTRYTDGKGLMIGGFATTATATTLSPVVTYDSPEGSGHTTTLTTPSTTVVRQCVPQLYPFGTLVAGDTGVTQITNIAWSATASGNFCTFICKPLMIIPTIAAASYIERDNTANIDGLIKLPRTSDNKLPCIGMLALANGTSACATQSGFVRKVNATTA